jgi:hypothetical protein
MTSKMLGIVRPDWTILLSHHISSDDYAPKPLHPGDVYIVIDVLRDDFYGDISAKLLTKHGVFYCRRKYRSPSFYNWYDQKIDSLQRSEREIHVDDYNGTNKSLGMSITYHGKFCRW